MTNRTQSSSPSRGKDADRPVSGPDFAPEPGTLVVEDFSLKHGFVQIPRIVLYARNLSRSAKMLYAVLLGYAWQEQQCFPGYTRLCDDLQATENSVRAYMRELEAANLLRQRRRGLGKTNLYILPDLRTAKIEVQEPQPIRPSKSEVLVPQEPQTLDPQESQDKLEAGKIETVEQETDSNISNIRSVQNGKLVQEIPVLVRTEPLASHSVQSTHAEAVGEVIARRFARAPRSRPRPETETDEYQRIQALIADRAREFIDTAPLKSSTTRAWNLFHRAGVPIDVFESKIFQAKALTLEGTARITKTAEVPGLGGRRKSKMAYFFATLEDQLNLLTPEERARRNGEGEQPASTTQETPAQERARAPKRSPNGRRPDREGPYGAWIKS